MADPGFQYLYKDPSNNARQRHHEANDQGDQAPVLSMSHLPRDPTSTASTRDWGPAIGNLENTKVALDALRGLINDAVFLDEEAFTNVSTLQMYQQRIQVSSAPQFRCRSGGGSWACS